METMPYLRDAILRRDDVPDFDEYPFNLPVPRNFTRLAFHPAVTYFVGENGTGKSTLLEAIAVAYPNARIYQLSEDGIKTVQYEETEHYFVTKEFLNNREKMLKILMEG
jgi:predicted ATPase